MAKRTPTSPVKAHHRYLRTIVQSVEKKAKLEPKPDELDLVAKVFRQAGGSWERVFEGSIDDIQLLKKTIKIATKKGILSKATTWG